MNWVQDLGAGLAVILALIAFLRIVFGWSFVRYVGRAIVVLPAKTAVVEAAREDLLPVIEAHNAGVNEKLDRIMEQLEYNGGSTVKDMVRRTVGQNEGLEEQIGQLRERVETVEVFKVQQVVAELRRQEQEGP